MSRRSKSDAGIQIWLKFGPVPPAAELLVTLDDALKRMLAMYGFTIVGFESWVKDGRVTETRDDEDEREAADGSATQDGPVGSLQPLDDRRTC